MKNNNSAAPKAAIFIKLLFFSIVGIILITFFAVGLRRIAVFSPARAESKNYLLVQSPTPLYADNLLSSELITLPTGYYAEILSTSPSIARVKYNGITGFVGLGESVISTTTPSGELFQTAEIKSRDDAGTHLRKSPTTDSEKVALIPPGSTLEFVGEIKSMTPPDGTTNSWFYVHFNASATTTYTGYIYSERVEIISGKIDRVPNLATPEVSTPTSTTPENLDATKTDDLQVHTNISSGLKIFLIILFISLGLIIFALLLISPKGKNAKNSVAKIAKSAKENSGPIKKPQPNFPPVAEFGEFVDFDESRNNRSRKNPKFYAKDNSSHIPPSLARFFKTESASDDEL